MVLYEAFDNPSDILDKLVSYKLNSKLKDLMIKKRIDLKTINAKRVDGPISNRSPLWKNDIDTALDNGRLLVMLFPSGYLYVPGWSNDVYMPYVDKPKGTKADSYSQLSKTFISEVAEPYILTVSPKPNRDHYNDPRNTSTGKYAGQVLNPNYDPNSDFSWNTKYRTNVYGSSRIDGARDKSGYMVRSMADMKAQLYKKFKAGDVDTDLYNRFKDIAQDITSLISRFRNIDPSSSIVDYDKNFKAYYGDDMQDYLDAYDTASRQIYSLIREYRTCMGDINHARDWNADFGTEFNVSDTLRSLDRLKSHIKEFETVLNKLESLI